MKRILPVLLGFFVLLSCNEAKDPASVKAKLLADEDFKQYVVAQKQKIASGGSDAKAEEESFRYFQKIYKNYISKNLLTTQEFNEITKEELMK